MTRIFLKQKGGKTMIKGINHQVIEITDTDNRYYERALFMLRPEYASIQRELLEKEACKMLKDLDTMATTKPKSTLPCRILNAVLNIAVGVLITVCIYSFV